MKILYPTISIIAIAFLLMPVASEARGFGGGGWRGGAVGRPIFGGGGVIAQPHYTYGGGGVIVPQHNIYGGGGNPPYHGYRNAYGYRPYGYYGYGRYMRYNPYWGWGGYGYGYGYGSGYNAYPDYEYRPPVDTRFDDWNRAEIKRLSSLPASAFVKNYSWPTKKEEQQVATKKSQQVAGSPNAIVH